ncbi:hypothetical protein [Streptomyces sp. NPDC047014]|uniref:hypothetical protein n=1 Tax=Streptomyces sp. NPDC047014 TaxID=3155736 RepID=UPI0034102642
MSARQRRRVALLGQLGLFLGGVFLGGGQRGVYPPTAQQAGGAGVEDGDAADDVSDVALGGVAVILTPQSMSGVK